MKRVAVVWEDSCSHDSWEEIQGFKLSPAIINSLGWLISEEKDFILLALNYDPENQMASQLIAIPKAVIKNILELDHKTGFSLN